MAEYIRKDSVISRGRDFLAGVLFVRKGRSSGKTQEMFVELMNHVVSNTPAEDVVPVVRCEKCAKRGKKDEFFWCKPCGYRCNEKGWFCPAGVRRDGDES